MLVTGENDENIVIQRKTRYGEDQALPVV